VVIAENACAHCHQHDADDDDGSDDASTPGRAPDNANNVTVSHTTFTPKTMPAPYGRAHRIINFAVCTTSTAGLMNANIQSETSATDWEIVITRVVDASLAHSDWTY
jgi:hypothetical protein